MSDLLESAVVRTVTCADADPALLLDLEWLVTNGLGGYASGTLAGVATRRYHGLLVASLPVVGRALLLNDLGHEARLPDGTTARFGDEEREVHLSAFRLEGGLPVWRYDLGSVVLERRVLMPHGQNTVHVSYRLVKGDGRVRLKLSPSLAVRPHDAPFDELVRRTYTLSTTGGDRHEVHVGPDLPPLRLTLLGDRAAFTREWQSGRRVVHRVEASRGYDSVSAVVEPGHFSADLTPEHPEATLVASTESWERILALSPDDARERERRRRQRLLAQAGGRVDPTPGGELVLAADAFVVTPRSRAKDGATARPAGGEYRSVIAGYHWFTDWGRDTMISLEGLTLTTGRHGEARDILLTFAQHVRDGLIPNLFPEGQDDGLYHTADATLWFFHALHRYVTVSGDRALLAHLLPTLRAIVDAHLAGTRYGIGVDPKDGLLRQGAPGYQLTWMDAKVGDWVVTPRRGKAVEINALWYNALRLLEGWVRELEGDEPARGVRDHADRARESFNARFFYAPGGHLHDVVDGEQGDDPTCRPNQVFALSLAHPVLDRSRWASVMKVVEERLLTPVGLRTLAPDHPDFKARCEGDLRARDAAYHQGTVWAWLIGPFVDAWLKLHPGEEAAARRFLEGLAAHLGDAGIGQVSEIFDGEAPFTPRGCVAQAWSVAELLRCWVKTSS